MNLKYTARKYAYVLLPSDASESEAYLAVSTGKYLVRLGDLSLTHDDWRSLVWRLHQDVRDQVPGPPPIHIGCLVRAKENVTFRARMVTAGTYGVVQYVADHDFCAPKARYGVRWLIPTGEVTFEVPVEQLEAQHL